VESRSQLSREETMVRRLFSLLALCIATYAFTACTSPTAPKAECAVSGGSGTCTGH
jgi:hypothetical protein